MPVTLQELKDAQADLSLNIEEMADVALHAIRLTERLKKELDKEVHASFSLEGQLHEWREKAKRYEKALCAILNIAAEDAQDGLIDIIIDAFKGYDLMDEYEEDALEGINLLAQSIEGSDEECK